MKHLKCTGLQVHWFRGIEGQMNPLKKWLIPLAPTLTFIGSRWEEFGSDFHFCSALKAFENQLPFCKKPIPLVALNHKSPPLLPLPICQVREIPGLCVQSRINHFLFYCIMRCRISHSGPSISYSGVSPEKFCLFYWIYSPENDIRIHPLRIVCKSKRTFIHQ